MYTKLRKGHSRMITLFTLAILITSFMIFIFGYNFFNIKPSWLPRKLIRYVIIILGFIIVYTLFSIAAPGVGERLLADQVYLQVNHSFWVNVFLMVIGATITFAGVYFRMYGKGKQ